MFDFFNQQPNLLQLHMQSKDVKHEKVEFEDCTPCRVVGMPRGRPLLHSHVDVW